MSIIIEDSENTQKIEGGKVKLTDANNKVIEVNINDISDASTYLNSSQSVIYDSDAKSLNYACEITDSEGNVMDEENLINDVKSGQVNSIDVTFEATHSGRNLNDAVYLSESMANDCNTFMFPYAKPLIKNHDSYEEPLGRVVASDFDKSEFVEDRDTINVTFRVSDQDAMQKFADGRYKTMSIGAQAKHIKCNVCGKDKLKDNKLKFCGHWRGERYADQVATWTMTDMEYNEGSVVNRPADVYAQVKRMKVNKSKGESNMDGKSKDGLTDVDNILNGVKDSSTEPTTQKPSTEPTATAQDGAKDPEANATNDSEEIAQLKAELQAAKDELETAKTTHTEEIAAKDTEIESLKAEVIVAKSNDAEKSKLIVKLANLNKELLKDSVRILNPEIKDEELNAKTASELGDMFEELKSNVVTSNDGQRVIKKVNNPGASINDNNTIQDDDGDVKDNVAKDDVKTMKDFEEVLKKVMRVN